MKRAKSIKRKADLKFGMLTDSDFPYEFRLFYNEGPPPEFSMVEDFETIESKYVSRDKKFYRRK